MPVSAKLLCYGTVVATITACLEEFAPKPVTTNQILDWLYPEGLDPNLRKKAYGSVASCLSNHTGQKWFRIKLGSYALDQKLAA